MKELNAIIESLMFVAEEPLTVDKLSAILDTVDRNEIRSVLQDLRDEYESRGGGFCLSEVAGGWQLRSRPEHHEWIKRMLQPAPQRLSRAALETLAIVAYKQPIIRADIEYIRGVDSGGVLRQLMERKLVRVLGRKEIPGRPLIYATTRLFLELFDLKDLKDLPSLKEIEELSGTSRTIEPHPDVSINENDELTEYEETDQPINAEELSDLPVDTVDGEPSGDISDHTDAGENPDILTPELEASSSANTPDPNCLPSQDETQLDKPHGES